MFAGGSERRVTSEALEERPLGDAQEQVEAACPDADRQADGDGMENDATNRAQLSRPKTLRQGAERRSAHVPILGEHVIARSEETGLRVDRLGSEGDAGDVV